MKSNAVSIKKNVIYNMLSQLLNFAVPLFIFPYISRVLNAEAIGMYSYTLSITTYFGMFCSLGIATYGQLKVAQIRDDKEKLSTFFVEIFFLKLFLFALSAGLYIIMIEQSDMYAKYYITLFSYLIAQLVDITWFWQGLEAFKTVTVRNIIIKILSCLLIFTCVKEEKDIYLYILIAQGSILISNLALWFNLKKFILFTVIFEKKIKGIFKHLKPSLVYFISTIASIILISMDKSMIGWITKSSYENGCYEQAYKVFQIGGGVICSLSLVILPRAAYLWENAEENVAIIKSIYINTLRVTMCLGIAIALGIWTISDNFVPIFFGSGYEGTTPILKVLSLVIPFSGTANVIGHQKLMACNKQKEYNIALVIACGVNVMCNIILINLFQSLGAAVATLISNVVLLLGFVYLSKDVPSLFSALKQSFKYIIAGVLMSFMVRESGNWLNGIKGLLLQIIIGVIGYFVCLLLMRDSLIINYLKIILNKLRK